MDIYERTPGPSCAQEARKSHHHHLPAQPMSEEEVAAAIKSAIAETGAASIKTWQGDRRAEAQHSGKMDFGKASGW